MNTEQIKAFLCQAKQQRYACSIKEENYTTEYTYESDQLRYRDKAVGLKQLIGEEVIWDQDQPIWGMNYTGRVVAEGFDAQVLNEILRQVTVESPYRGPQLIEVGDYTYRCRVEGDFSWFVGCEKLLYKGNKVYEAMFQGGSIQ